MKPPIPVELKAETLAYAIRFGIASNDPKEAVRWIEEFARQSRVKNVSSNSCVMLSLPSDEMIESFYPIKFKLGETRGEQMKKEKNLEIRKVIDWYKDLVIKANSERGNGA